MNREKSVKLLELMEQGIINAKWLATSLMDYISEDTVADFARDEEYFDIDEIESPYQVRQATNLFIEMFDEGLVDPEQVARQLISYISEDDIANFYSDEIGDDEDEESVEESTVLKDEEDDSEIKQWRIPNPLGIDTIFIGTEKAAKALCAKYGLTPEEVK